MAEPVGEDGGTESGRQGYAAAVNGLGSGLGAGRRRGGQQ
jgi:hypothetical protein